MLIAVRRYRTTPIAYAGSVVFFAVLTALAARVTIPLPFTPVPVTLQVMVVLLAGLVLGARGGAASQITYLAAIVAGLPLDARGLGPASLAGPTAGYLLGFTVGAFITGWLAERLSSSLVNRFVAALAGTRFERVPVTQAPRALAGAIGRIAAARLAAGEASDPAAIDANYVRRSDAELFWKDT